MIITTIMHYTCMCHNYFIIIIITYMLQCYNCRRKKSVSILYTVSTCSVELYREVNFILIIDPVGPPSSSTVDTLTFTSSPGQTVSYQ